MLQVLQQELSLPGGVDPRPAAAFGGGIGGAGSVCGAIAGGAIAIGLYCGQRLNDPLELKTTAGRMALALQRDFAAQFGATDCRALLGVDLTTPEGQQAFLNSTFKTDRCAHYVTYVVRRLLEPSDGFEQARHAVPPPPASESDQG